jgi:hypothetical protein
MFSQIRVPRATKVIIGSIPALNGPACLAQHATDVQACSISPRSRLSPFDAAERRAAQAAGAQYIDVTPWFCSKVCSPIIGDYDVYYNTGHVALAYSRFLEGALTNAIHLSTF